jgi:hypothetical protein
VNTFCSLVHGGGEGRGVEGEAMEGRGWEGGGDCVNGFSTGMIDGTGVLRAGHGVVMVRR